MNKSRDQVIYENLQNSGFLFVKTVECNFTNASMVLLKIHVTNFMCESCWK